MISEVAYKVYLWVVSTWSWWWESVKKQHEHAYMILSILVPTLLLLWYKWILSPSRNGRALLPPGPYGIPVLGYLPFLTSNLHERFTEMGDRYGPIFSLRLGSKLHVVVNSIDLVKVIVRDLDQTFANRSPPLVVITNSYGRNSIAWSNYTHWRSMRKLLVSQLMGGTNLKACQSFQTHEVRRMMNEVYSKMGTKVNINEISYNTAVNAMTSILWGSSKSVEGKDSSYIGGGFREVQSKIMELLGLPNISDFIPMLSRFDLQGRQKDMKKQLEYVDQIFDNIIQERILANHSKVNGAVEEDKRKDFVQMLLELKDQKDASASINIIQIKALLMDIVVGGTDSTATMIEWVMAEIFNNPGVMRRVQDELMEVIGNNFVEESHLPNLTYLDAVIMETFRLHPPLPLLVPRCPDESCIVGGYTIPKGTIVFINIWAIHRDPKNWTNPFEFNPERFFNGKWDYSGNNFMFLPFGSGRRICPGMLLAERMLMYMVASLLHSFNWSLPEDDEFELSDQFGIVMKKRKPLIAIPSQRLPDASLYVC